MSRLDALRDAIRAAHHRPEDDVLDGLRAGGAPDAATRAAARQRAIGLAARSGARAIRG